MVPHLRAPDVAWFRAAFRELDRTSLIADRLALDAPSADSVPTPRTDAIPQQLPDATACVLDDAIFGDDQDVGQGAAGLRGRRRRARSDATAFEDEPSVGH